jgi:hypothetical protein
MPAMSVFAFPVVIARAGVNGAHKYFVSPEDVTVVVQEMPTHGLKVVLPGATSPVPPSDGDFYFVADPLGLVNTNQPLEIDGHGFPILGSPSQHILDPFTFSAFQFDKVNRLWITFLGELPPKHLVSALQQRDLGLEPA